MRTSTLLLVGRNKLSRVGLKSLFTNSPFTVVGEVSDITTFDPASLPEPDIALVDCLREAGNVLTILARLRAIYPDTPAVVLSDQVCMATLAACLAAGASGFLTTDISPDALLRSLQLAVLGETVFPTDLAGLLVNGSREPQRPVAPSENACGLSDREIETVQCLIRGESNKLIAKRLNITEATIKVHIKSVLRKIKASNRTQAAIWALSQGYLPARDAAMIGEGRGQFGLN
jgi:two-component system, NarL family, nitrate/nitrite response regulator NarL